jgi:hypothetical protein
MHLTLTDAPNGSLAAPASTDLRIATPQDALELAANAAYLGATGVVLPAARLAPEFFDLRTGLAGEMLQKFSNYDMRLAIVGDFAGYDSPALHAFIGESNRQGRISFVGSEAEARAALTRV